MLDVCIWFISASINKLPVCRLNSNIKIIIILWLKWKNNLVEV